MYWGAVGKEIAQIALNGGGSDLSHLQERCILYAELERYEREESGATDRRDVTTSEELDHLIREAGKIPAQRDTFYNILRYP